MSCELIKWRTLASRLLLIIFSLFPCLSIKWIINLFVNTIMFRLSGVSLKIPPTYPFSHTHKTQFRYSSSFSQLFDANGKYIEYFDIFTQTHQFTHIRWLQLNSIDKELQNASNSIATTTSEFWIPLKYFIQSNYMQSNYNLFAFQRNNDVLYLAWKQRVATCNITHDAHKPAHLKPIQIDNLRWWQQTPSPFRP